MSMFNDGMHEARMQSKEEALATLKELIANASSKEETKKLQHIVMLVREIS